MQTVVQTDLTGVFDEIADFFADSPTAEAIALFRLSDGSEQIIHDLLEANRARGLTPDERAALDDYARVERLVQAIKLRAFAKLGRASL